MVQRFEHRIAIAALAASATAIAVARFLLGDAPDFHVNALGYGDAIRPLYFAVGGFAGLLAVPYNRVLLATIEGADWLSRLPPVLRYKIHTSRRVQPCLIAWNLVRPLSMTMGPGLP